MVLFVVVRVVDQNVEYHAAKQLAHVADINVSFGDAPTAQELRQLRIAEALPRRPQGNGRGKSVDSLSAITIEPFHGDRVTVSQSDRHGRGNPDFRFLRECHRSMFDQGSVGGFAIGEFDDPLIAAMLRSALGRAPPMVTPGEMSRFCSGGTGSLSCTLRMSS